MVFSFWFVVLHKRNRLRADLALSRRLFPKEGGTRYESLHQLQGIVLNVLFVKNFFENGALKGAFLLYPALSVLENFVLDGN